MLSKVCSTIVRHSNHSNPLRIGRNARMNQLNNDCMTALRKVEINQSLQKTIADLDAQYCLDLALEAEDEFQQLPASAIFEADDSPEAEARARGLQLARGLEQTKYFLEKYSVTVPDITLDAAINPRHKLNLINSLHRSFPLLSPSDQLAFIGAVQPQVLGRLGFNLSPEYLQLSIANQQAGKPQLNENHVLALLDYCSSSSGMFNSVNDGKRVWQLCGIGTLAAITACLSQPLDEALNILSLHEAFIYSGPAYKGIALANAAGQFRLSRMQPGMQYKGAHWSSATWIEKMNYANNKMDDNRCSKLTVVHAEGVRVHIFNDESSIGEGEVMMRPQTFYFLAASQVDPGLSKPLIDRPTIFCTMKPTQPEARSTGLGRHAVPV